MNEKTKLKAVPTLGKALLEALPDMCFIVSPSGEILEANQKALLAIASDGLPSSAYGMFISQIGPPFQAAFSQRLAACLRAGRLETMEAELRPGGGDEPAVNVELFLSPFPLGEHAEGPLACLVTARDISDRKRKELDLLRFTNMAHYTVNPIEITDTGGHIIYVNPAFERASGYSKEEVIGKNPNIFSSGKHPKSFWQAMWRTISAGNVWVGEVENKSRNGEPFYTNLLISPIMDAGGPIIGYFGIHRDISGQKQLEQQLIHAQKMESIGMLAAGLAHEVGNPLASISSLVQIIQRTNQDEFTQDKLELIKSQIARISRIIRDLVDFSRRSNYEVQLTDVNKNIRDAIEIVRVGRKAKDIAFSLTLEEKLPLLMLVPDQIEQVIINLLINAVDALYEPAAQYQPAGKEKLITVRSSLTDDHILVIVQDTGKGIREEDLRKIFEPFYTTKKVGEGTGLGLWVSYGIIKSFRGEIRVKSTEGVCTTFTIRLPVHL
jgi:PAS domain S-box-containing protein